MATITPTAANIRVGTGLSTSTATAGEALDPWDLLYLKSDGKYWKADNNVTAVEANWSAVAMTTAAADANVTIGQPTTTGTAYLVSSAALWTKGTWYCLADTAGDHMPTADLIGATGEYSSLVGYATSTTELQLYPIITGNTA